MDLPFFIWIVDDSTNTAAVKICRWKPYRLNCEFSLILICKLPGGGREGWLCTVLKRSQSKKGDPLERML